MNRPSSHQRAVLMLVLIAALAAFALPRLEIGRSQAAPPAASPPSSSVTPVPTTVPPADVPPPGPVVDASCSTAVPHEPTGELVVVPGATMPSSEGPIKTYIVEVEEGLGIDAGCFATRVHEVLSDPRSWGGREGFAVQRVDVGEPTFRVTLASPATTDEHCGFLNTGSIYSCWDAQRAMINVWRWETGTDDYDGNLLAYQTYVINHEVGHGLGHRHVECTGPGDLAPVMMQQTKGLDGCLQNGWPLDQEVSVPPEGDDEPRPSRSRPEPLSRSPA